MARFFRILFGLAIIVAILYIIVSIRPYRVSGDSMQPNLNDGQLVLIDRISTHLYPLQRGENIVFRDMNEEGEIKVKRVVGLPGETIQIVDGRVMLGTNEIKEPYLGKQVHTCLPGACVDLTSHIFNVPEKSYFVLGDNRGVSRDSRGCNDVADCQNRKPVYIPREEILGRVFFPW